MGQEITGGHTSEIEAAILQRLERLGSCGLEEFLEALPGHTWTQVFTAIDRLSRDGTVILRRPARFEYVVEAAIRRAS
ncbi:MAG: hypothetical protein EPO02_00570 [Nitrospirae bacterium]|nr:MAG: hypothetical protein EPO02_00570 [Nitrospirota bacterium]